MQSNQADQYRRRFLTGSLGTLAAGMTAPLWAGEEQPTTEPTTGKAIQKPAAPQKITLAQVATTGNVSQNLERAEAVFRQAKKDEAGWVLFPELFLTGTYHGDRFKQLEVAPAFRQMADWCRESGVIGLIGTGWREKNGVTYNQLRIVDRSGKLVSVYAKTCLTYGDAKEFSPGPLTMLHEAGGIRFGTLICNDFWVTPGFSDGPNPHLSLKLAKAGAQVIFLAVGSGSDLRYLSYHDSNVLTRAAEAKCPVVVVNGFRPPESNVTSGVAGTDVKHIITLPRDCEVVRTVSFTPLDR